MNDEERLDRRYDGDPCTCKDDCPEDCCGEMGTTNGCECQACFMRWADAYADASAASQYE